MLGGQGNLALDYHMRVNLIIVRKYICGCMRESHLRPLEKLVENSKERKFLACLTNNKVSPMGEN